MANTYRLISSTTLSSSAASVTFSNIDSSYTDLIVKMSTRDSVAGIDTGQINITFNSDSSTNYSQTFVYGNGSSVGNGTVSNFTRIYNSTTSDSAGNTANTFTSSEIYIPLYTVAQNKPVSFIQADEDNTLANGFNYLAAGLWRSTAVITTIGISANSSFVSGSTFYLYGIANS